MVTLLHDLVPFVGCHGWEDHFLSGSKHQDYPRLVIIITVDGWNQTTTWDVKKRCKYYLSLNGLAGFLNHQQSMGSPAAQVEQEVETADPVDDNAPEDAPTISEVDAAYFEVWPRGHRSTGLQGSNSIHIGKGSNLMLKSMVILREFPTNSWLFSFVSKNVFWPSSEQRLKNKYRGFLLRPFCKQRQFVGSLHSIFFPFHSIPSLPMAKGQRTCCYISIFGRKKHVNPQTQRFPKFISSRIFFMDTEHLRCFNQGGCRSTGLWPFGCAYLDVERFSTFGVLPGCYTGTQLAGRVDMDGYGWLVWLVVLMSRI